jgi:hypothetical protein
MYHCFLPLVLLLKNQGCISQLKLQVSDCSTYLIMCDVPSTAVFFIEGLLKVSETSVKEDIWT